MKADLEKARKAGEQASKMARTMARSLEDARKAALMFEDIHFDSDKTVPNEDALAKLTQYAMALLQYPDVEMLIEGHSDEQGMTKYNLALGERRALTVKNYLMKLGVAEHRLSTVSYGEERPLDPGHTEEARAKNRRVHLVVKP
jgi:peptidoglycan-associated lipoprotein